MARFRFGRKNSFAWLSRATGVYCFKDKKNNFLYIGKASNLRERVKNHFQQPAYRGNLFISQVAKIGYLKTVSEIEALILEAKLIKKYQPKYNVLWRDDKNYFYIGVMKQDFPRVFITHQIEKLKAKSEKRKTTTKNLKLTKYVNYLGPFVDGRALRQALRTLRKVFPYRSCKTLPKRPCLWYQLDRCPGPCLLKPAKSSLLHSSILSARLQREVKKLSQRNAKNLMGILQGKRIQVLKDLKKEMRQLSKLQDFEKAAKIRDQIEALERVLAHARIFEEPTVPQTSLWYYKRVEGELKELLKMKERISRIEAYDVSNIQGQEATGSMVTFIKGRPDKAFYRRFKIHPVRYRTSNGVKISETPNDIAMLKEVLERRFKHPEWPLPDLILIDGGIAQFNAALKIKNQKGPYGESSKTTAKIKNKIKIISLAKKESKLFIEGKKEPILAKTLPREIFNLILQLDDEAHRFALTYHRKIRKKKLLSQPR